MSIGFIWPTKNDVNGGVPSFGRRASEEQMSKALGLAGLDYVETGITEGVASRDDGQDPVLLYFNVGIARIKGFRVEIDDQHEVSLASPASKVHRIWLQLVKSGGFVTGAQFVVTTDTAVPADAVMLWAVRVGSGNVVSHSYDMRARRSNVHTGQSYGDIADSGNDVVLGFRPKCLILGTTIMHDGDGNTVIKDYGFESSSAEFFSAW